MELVDGLFEIAKVTTTVNPEEIEILRRKAKADTEKYLSTDKGFKGMYRKLHNGWIFQLLLMIALPFLQAWLVKMKQRILFGSQEDSFEDEEPIEHDKSSPLNFFNSDNYRG